MITTGTAMFIIVPKLRTEKCSGAKKNIFAEPVLIHSVGSMASLQN
jgi:hypothetical protein